LEKKIEIRFLKVLQDDSHRPPTSAPTNLGNCKSECMSCHMGSRRP